MGLVRHVFQRQLRRFNKTKTLTRGLKGDGDDDDGEVVDEDEFKEKEGIDSDDMDEEKNGEEDETDQFTGDGVGKLADNVTKPKLVGEETKDKESHFKSVLKDLEEDVSEDDDAS